MITNGEIFMQIQIALPDNIVSSLEAKWGSLECRLMEMVIVEAYWQRSISVGKVRELLGMKTRLEVDAFLKAKGVDLPYSEADLEADIKSMNNCDKKKN
jgi:predicted HTH domain antitoxin